jgi:hypothetical protein
MKLTKSRLKRLIREELQEAGVSLTDKGLGMPGGSTGGLDPHTAALEELKQYIKTKYSRDEKLLALLEDAIEKTVQFENDVVDLDTEIGQRVLNTLKADAEEGRYDF